MKEGITNFRAMLARTSLPPAEKEWEGEGERRSQSRRVESEEAEKSELLSSCENLRMRGRVQSSKTFLCVERCIAVRALTPLRIENGFDCWRGARTVVSGDATSRKQAHSFLGRASTRGGRGGASAARVWHVKLTGASRGWKIFLGSFDYCGMEGSFGQVGTGCKPHRIALTRAACPARTAQHPSVARSYTCQPHCSHASTDFLSHVGTPCFPVILAVLGGAGGGRGLRTVGNRSKGAHISHVPMSQV